MIGFLDHTGGQALTEKVIDHARLSHDGAYAPVSRYSWEEAMEMVAAASSLSGLEAATLSEDFGTFRLIVSRCSIPTS